MPIERKQSGPQGGLRLALIAILIGLFGVPLAAGQPAATVKFDRDIAPLLARRCLDCHNEGDKKGGLDLTTAAGAKTGGDSGEVLSADGADASLLWQRVADNEMPPKTPLPAAEKELLRAWIAAGAAWETSPIDRFRVTSDTRAGLDWWALQPLGQARPPAVRQAGWPRQPLDKFILARLETKALAPSPETDRRGLTRRVSFDLIGLPPTPDEVQAFIDDKAADAYERLVDRLLASPHFGERAARHWLDVARFGESDGFEYDRLRPTAWRYRDWVIEALNDDMPYDEFARLQIAGDVLKPDDPNAVTATGFLVAGAYDGLIPAGDVMKRVMRQDELEDLVGTVAQTFLGLTVHCARCHDHKFDPIRQTDYYRLASALAGVGRGERSLPARPKNATELASQLAELRSQLEVIDAPGRATVLEQRGKATPDLKLPEPLAAWDFTAGSGAAATKGSSLGELQLVGAAKLSAEGLALDGRSAYAQTPLVEKPLRAKTLEAVVLLANRTQRGGAAISVESAGGEFFDAIVFGEQEPGHWMAGSDFFRRTKTASGSMETADSGEAVHVAITYDEQGAITLYRNGQPYGNPYRSAGLHEFQPGKWRVVFGLRHNPVNESKLLSGIVRRASLYDRALSAEEVAAAAAGLNRGVSEPELVAQLDAAARTRRAELLARIRVLSEQSSPEPLKVFAVTPRQAPVVHRLDRGNPLAEREAVAPGSVPAIAGVDADFHLPADAPEADRRRRLAEAVTNPANPLFARVLVNRVWQQHFGCGLVDTPNDFGFNGGRPSDRELLDYLAVQFVQSGFRIKALHRLIVTSATYRQSCAANDKAMAVDAGNRMLWRYSPRRLEAEAVRDAVLAVSGQLNLARGGPGYRDFDSFDQKGTQTYEPRDPEGPEFNRRSLYRTWARGGRNPLLDTFDCPDPSVTTPSRGVTTTPLQALSLWNNSFVLRMSEHFARRIEQEAGKEPAAQAKRAFRLALGREPTPAEQKRIEPFVAQHGLPALCRTLLNSNEFLYVE